LKVMSLMYREF